MVLVSVMLEGNGGVPTSSEVQSWVEQHGLTHPVLLDEMQTQMPYIVTGYPTYVVIDRAMVIQNADMWPWDDDFVLSLI